MAYKSSFNPDALPAHVEPQQAAQLLGQQQKPPSSSASPAPPSQEPSWANKPPPPLPGQVPPAGRGHAPPNRQSHSVSPRMDHVGPRRPSAPSSTASYGSSYQAGSFGGSYQHPQQQLPGGVQDPYYGNQAYASHGRAHSNTIGARPPIPSPGPVPPIANIPPAGSDAALFPIFRAVDTSGTGQLTEEQLGRALRNGDYSMFDPETVRLMIKMFDHDHSGTIGFEEFCGLHGFLHAWRQLFDRFDEDRSGYISLDEFSNALTAFGYHLTPSFISHMYGIYDRRKAGAMTFDLFVQSCISLKRMTDVFKQYDTDRDGYITMSFEEFLREILNQR